MIGINIEDHIFTGKMSENNSLNSKQNGFVRTLRYLFSFELLFTLFLLAWAYKADPRFAWIPVDPTLLFFILSVCSGILVFLNEKKRFTKKALAIVFSGISFVSYTLISLIWTPGHVYAQQKALYFSTLTLWTLIACALIIASDKRRMLRFINLLLAFSVWIALESFLEFIKGGGTVINALNSNYLALGYMLGTGLMVSASGLFFSELDRVKRLSMFLLSVYFIFLLLNMGGRGPLLSLTISLLIPILFRSRLLQPYQAKLKKYGVFIAILFAALIFISLYLYSRNTLTTTLYRFLLFFGPGMGSSAGTRIGYYTASEKLWLLNPVFGHGIGSWPILMGLPDMYSYPHNLIFEILVELGAVGLILFGLILFNAFKGVKKSLNKNIFIGSVTLMMLVNAIIGAMFSGDINDNRIMFALIGLMAYEENFNGEKDMHSDISSSGR